MRHLLVLAFIVLLVGCAGEAPRPDHLAVFTNQIGFAPDQAKDVVVAYAETLENPGFELVDEHGEVRFRGVLEPRGFDPDSGDWVARGDFTDLDTPGRYRVRTQAGLESHPFEIGESANVEVLRSALRWLYLQRSGRALDDPLTGISHGADLTEPAIIWGPEGPEERTMDVTGGWWDAGDYGRYVSPAAATIMSLLYAWRFNPDVFADGFTEIPESGNGVPDILDEVRWELEWMMKMQRTDGAVHHKATFTYYPECMPEDVEDPVYVFDVSTQATAQFAGAMATAATVFESFDADLTRELLAAAGRAWQWLAANPDKYPDGGFDNPFLPDGTQVTGGPYSVHAADETEHRMWAAASLFLATGEERYGEVVARMWSRRDLTDPFFDMSWADGAAFAVFTSLDNERLDPDLRQEMIAELERQAETLLEVTSGGYGVALRGVEPPFPYTWGSIEYALQRATFLLLLDEHAPDQRYEVTAAHQLSWVLGANPLGLCYLTGAGSNPPRTLHHAISMINGEPFPGAVGEGPNAALTGGDPALEAMLAEDPPPPPAKCFVDDWASYASNEPTIYGNAAFVSVAARFTGPPS
jgi:endoglucanase